ncbi:DpnD/PcfM family protein [Acinetobacter sp. c2-A9]|uniref:DpnD/PcfM family protein n=1 Tax=Acinetobacter sp. c2-A9 TaxID=3342802 RepID=UPI0035BAB26C
MPNFHIEIVETLSTVIDIEADNLNEALVIAKQKYLNSEIVLDYSNHTHTNFLEFSDTL